MAFEWTAMNSEGFFLKNAKNENRHFSKKQWGHFEFHPHLASRNKFYHFTYVM